MARELIKTAVPENLNKNFIINGAMDFWQRGAGPTTGTGYVADRWGVTASFTGGAIQQSRVTATTPSGIANYALRIAHITANCTAIATEIDVRQTIEKQFIKQAWNKDITISFYVRSNRIGSTLGFQFFTAGNGIGTFGGARIPITIQSSGTWQKVVYQTTFNPATFDNTGLNGIGAYLDIGWQTTAVPLIAGTDYFEITEVMLSLGKTSDPIFNRAGGDLASELRLCQRYYEKTYDIDTAPGTATGSGMLITLSSGTGIGNVSIGFQFKVTKRTPTVSCNLYNPNTGAVGSMDRNGTAVAAIVLMTSSSSVAMRNDAATTDTTGHTVHFTVDAEL